MKNIKAKLNLKKNRKYINKIFLLKFEIIFSFIIITLFKNNSKELKVCLCTPVKKENNI